jgi:hypothetical protein
MLRRLFYRPLYILFTEDSWLFCDDKPRLRHHIKILMTVTQLKKYDQEFRPGFYEVKMQLIERQPTLVFLPLRK